MARSLRTAFFLIAGILVFPVFAEWLDEPEQGWVFEYYAASGFLPDEAASGASSLKNAWYGNQEKENTSWASIKVEDGECVLHLANRGKNIGDEKWDWAHFRTDQSSRRSKSKFLTVDFEFRVIASAEKGSKFSVSAEFPEEGIERKSWICWIAFAENTVSYFIGEKLVDVKTVPLTEWHRARVYMDMAKGKYSLYLDGVETPLFEADLRMRNERIFKVQFGDGSRGIRGDAELKYFRWTDRELVPVTNKSGDK